MLNRLPNTPKSWPYPLALAVGLWFAGCATADEIQPPLNNIAETSETNSLMGCYRLSDAADQEAAQERCKASKALFAAIKKSTLNRWIELESDRRNQRVYVAIPDQHDPYSDTSRRIYLRYDADPNTVIDLDANIKTPAVIVQTMDLNCSRSETTTGAMHYYDKEGKLEFSTDVETPKVERILSFHQSPLRLVCSDEYLLQFMPGIEKFTTQFRKTKAEQLKTLIPDRTVPIPE